MPAYHLKYRPANLDEVVGNLTCVEMLKEVLERDEEDRPHVYLFSGPRGCGKTTLARILKDYVNCNKVNFFEYNVANVRGIDTVRGIIEKSALAALGGGSKVYLLDECHQMTSDAKEALLKVTEDTPRHVYFVLCTTEPEALPDTLRRRCMSFTVGLLPPRFMVKLLKRVVEEEDLSVGGEVLKKIARVSQGSPGEALVLLDQVRGLDSDDRILQALDGMVLSAEAEVREICQLLMKRSPRWSEMALLAKGLKGKPPDPIRRGIAGYLTAVFLNRKQGDDRLALVIDCFLEPVFYSGYPGLVNQLYLACKI